MSYRVLKQDDQGEETRSLPPYATQQPIPLTNQQQISTVVASQPCTIPQVSVEQPRPRTKPGMLIFTIVLSIVCGIHLCLPAFVCLAPALIFSIVGYSLSDSPSDEQKKTAKAFHGVALCCNISTIIFYVVSAIAVIISVGTSLGLAYQYSHEYYSYYGGCYEDCSAPQYDYGSGYYDDGCRTICVN